MPKLRRLTLSIAAVALTIAAVTIGPVDTVGAAPRLSASRTNGLNPLGETIRVQGSGFDETKGIYLALCVKAPKPTMAPAPCGGGGILLEGSDGSSQWISSNPPPYGVGLAIPYGPGGTFDLTIHISTIIQAATATTPAIDCRVVTCGISTRADHLRSGDRSQDYFIPVTFAGPPPTTTTPPPTTQTTQPSRPPATQSPATPSKGATTPRPGSATSGAAQGSSPNAAGTGSPSAADPTGSGTAGQADLAQGNTEVTIPSSLFGEEQPDGDGSDQTDTGSPEATVQGESESANEGPELAEAGSPRTQEVALEHGSSSSGGSSGWIPLIGVALVAAAATGGGLFWRRRTAAVGISDDTSQVPDA